MDEPDQNGVPHMPADRFRTLGKRMIDWVADYLATVGSRDVKPPTEPGDVLALLPDDAPRRPAGAEEWDAIFRDLDSVIVPNTTHWQHPNFFAYFPCNASEPAILGDLAATGLGVQGMLWQTAPAANELERRLLDQFGRLIGLPEPFTSAGGSGGGCIQHTASDAALSTLVAARHRTLRANPGVEPGGLTIYASSEAHSSVMKAAMIAGIARAASDHARVRFIEPDGTRAMNADALRHAIDEDTRAGLTPCWVVATLGTTATGMFDDLRAVAGAIPDTCWLHVDAAWAGAALVCEEHRGMIDGVERADSFNFNPHKWLLTSFDCSLFWTRDRRALTDSMSISPSYLRASTDEDDDVFDYRDWGVPLGRKARAIKLWFVLRHYGVDGLRAHIRDGVRLAQQLESWIEADPRFRLSCPRSLSLLCIESSRGDDHTRAILERVNASGRAWLTPTAYNGRTTIRVAIGGVRTTERSVRELWGLLADAAEE